MFGEEIFRSGTLEMATEPWDDLARSALWLDLPVNRILCLVGVFLIILNLMDYIRLMPALLFCADRPRGAEALEHSLDQARSRNLTALVYLLPLILALDRHTTVRPDFWSQIPPAWSVAAMAGLILAFLLLRRLCYLVFRPRRVPGEAYSAMRHNPFNYLLLAAPVLFLTMGVFAIFHLTETTASRVILVEIGIAWAFAFFRTGQILSKHCSGLSTILYLCALELLPAAALVAVVMLF